MQKAKRCSVALSNSTVTRVERARRRAAIAGAQPAISTLLSKLIELGLDALEGTDVIAPPSRRCA